MAPHPRDRFSSTAALGRELKNLLKAPQPADASTWDTESSCDAVAAPETLPELAQIELVPLETPWESLRAKFPWSGRGAVIFVLLLLVGLGATLSILTFRPVSPAKEEIGTPVVRKGQVSIPEGVARLGNDPAKLRAFLSSYLQERQLERALGFFKQEPRREVTVPAFWIDQYEVTNAQYAAYLRDTGREPPDHWKGVDPPRGKEDHPVVNVFYEDAAAYAQWAGKELPTREQWMRAFRGDNDWLFPWGDVYERVRANVGDNPKYPATSRVKDTPKDVTPFGVYNMVGNVSEFIRGTYFHKGKEWRVAKGAECKLPGYSYGIGSYQVLYGLAVKDMSVGFRCVTEGEHGP